MKISSNKKIKLLVGFLVLTSFIFVSPAGAQQSNAKVYLSGPDFALAPESKFLVNVFLDSREVINAFDLEIIYPKDKLKFLSFDNTQSIVDIWHSTPDVSESGHIKLGGGMLQGWSGTKGLLIKISFKALLPSTPEFSFLKTNLYLADGEGTEVKALGVPNKFTVKEEGKVVSTPAVPFKDTPSDIIIKKELETYKKEVFKRTMTTPIILVVSLIFVICLYAVYNKRKPKL